MSFDPSCVGAVVIGRNEGERLLSCFDSLMPQVGTVVYVDSGSDDGSVEAASSRGIEVLSLDTHRPFTAARARNAGFRRLIQRRPHLRFVQFVDGDCRVSPGWVETAVRCIDEDPAVAVVCGRRRETEPEASIYNRLCDLEWDTPVGLAEACGGDGLMRVEALKAVGGYRDDLIAGEEPELCVRLRSEGRLVRRIGAEMTEHDAAIIRFAQWWRRARRAGHAFAEVSWIHAGRPCAIWGREVAGIALWGVAVPATILAAALLTPWGAALSLVYPLQALRVFLRSLRSGRSARDAAAYGLFCTIAKFPQAVGGFEYHLGRCLGRRRRLIEYKRPRASSAASAVGGAGSDGVFS